MDSNLVVGDDSTHLETASLDLLALELRFFGATITTQMDEHLSHVIVDDR